MSETPHSTGGNMSELREPWTWQYEVGGEGLTRRAILKDADGRYIATCVSPAHARRLIEAMKPRPAPSRSAEEEARVILNWYSDDIPNADVHPLILKDIAAALAAREEQFKEKVIRRLKEMRDDIAGYGPENDQDLQSGITMSIAAISASSGEKS